MKFTSVDIEARKKIDLRSGDTVLVMQKIEEKGKIRLQPFEGLVISINHGREPGATFTVRRVINGFGVEKIFPFYSPVVDSIKIIKRSKVKRSKLYYVRESALKQIKKRMKMMFVNSVEEDVVEPQPEDQLENQPEIVEQTEDLKEGVVEQTEEITPEKIESAESTETQEVKTEK